MKQHLNNSSALFFWLGSLLLLQFYLIFHSVFALEIPKPLEITFLVSTWALSIYFFLNCPKNQKRRFLKIIRILIFIQLVFTGISLVLMGAQVAAGGFKVLTSTSMYLQILIPDTIYLYFSKTSIFALLASIFFLSSNFFVLKHQQEFKDLRKDISSLSILRLLYLISIAYFTMPNVLYAYEAFRVDAFNITRNLTSTVAEKQVAQMGGKDFGGWTSVYADFINQNTPESAVILTPPQRHNWQAEGNSDYFRWFVYPRFLIRSDEIELNIPETATHVLIAHGNWIWGSDEYCWPRNPIEGDRVKAVTLINREDLSTRKLESNLFIPNCEIEQWGIIELR